MKILIFTDNHFSATSSIVRAQGEKYTVRLENQIASLNWVERIAKEKGCSSVICAGDFFDKPQIKDMEITALREIQWNDLPHYFLVGNHESSVNGLEYNSTKALEGQLRTIISKTNFSIIDGKTQIHFVPYIIESDRKPLEAYISKNSNCKKHIIISHNDIAGIAYGSIESKTGFKVEEFDIADLTINGHIHSGSWVVQDKVCNLGSLTGISFNENALVYKHNIMILDTDTLKYELIENPYAMNFLSLQVKDLADLQKVLTEAKMIPNLVLSVKCPAKVSEDIKNYINGLPNVLTSRITSEYDLGEKVDSAEDTDINTIENHIDKFKYFILENLGNTDIINAELAEICR